MSLYKYEKFCMWVCITTIFIRGLMSLAMPYSFFFQLGFHFVNISSSLCVWVFFFFFEKHVCMSYLCNCYLFVLSMLHLRLINWPPQRINCKINKISSKQTQRSKQFFFFKIFFFFLNSIWFSLSFYYYYYYLEFISYICECENLLWSIYPPRYITYKFLQKRRRRQPHNSQKYISKY